MPVLPVGIQEDFPEEAAFELPLKGLIGFLQVEKKNLFIKVATMPNPS